MQRLRVYIWNVTAGGRALEGEQRIQITRQPLTRPPDGDAILLGWHEDAGVFVAFDLDVHAAPGASASVQVKVQTLELAAEQGMSLQRRGSTEVAVAFRPENLVEYLECKSEVHRAGAIPDPTPELGLDQPEASAIPELEPPERERLTTVVSRLLRDASFRTRVLDAYGHACCACGLQLGLIEAAHVIPVAVPGSTDETTNGLALCVLHHRAYDAGLISIRGDGSIHVDEAAIAFLLERGEGGGELALREGMFVRIRFPADELDWPLPGTLERGTQLRGH